MQYLVAVCSRIVHQIIGPNDGEEDRRNRGGMHSIIIPILADIWIKDLCAPRCHSGVATAYLLVLYVRRIISPIKPRIFGHECFSSSNCKSQEHEGLPQSFNFYLARQTSEWQVPNEKIVEMHYVPLVSKICNYFILFLSS